MVSRVVFRFLSLVTAGIGLLTMLLAFGASAGGKLTAVTYSGLTLLIAGLLALIRGQKAVPDMNKEETESTATSLR